jgi:hypothetical protein
MLPFAAGSAGFVDWLVNEAHFGLFTFRDLTRAIAVIDVPYRRCWACCRAGDAASACRCRRWAGWA